jgi:glycine cleavage system H protein
MEGFTYSNIFETKGIEYIIVIFFLLILIPFWIFVNRKVPVKEQFQQALNVLTAGVLRIPHGLLFSKNHTWVSLEKTGYAKFGIDDFLQKIVGETQFVPLKTQGEVVQKGEILAEINQKGKRLKVLSPISGEIMAVNIHKTNLGLPGSDPYEKGWFYSLKPFNWKAETSGFFIADEAGTWIKKELERFKDFLNVSLAQHSGQPSTVAFQEGGELMLNPLSEMHPEIWNKFQKEFLE